VSQIDSLAPNPFATDIGSRSNDTARGVLLTAASCLARSFDRLDSWRPQHPDPPPGCPRSSWRQRTHYSPSKFSCFELTTGRDGGGLPRTVCVTQCGSPVRCFSPRTRTAYCGYWWAIPA